LWTFKDINAKTETKSNELVFLVCRGTMTCQSNKTSTTVIDRHDEEHEKERENDTVKLIHLLRLDRYPLQQEHSQ